jgi:hypothetical protein
VQASHVIVGARLGEMLGASVGDIDGLGRKMGSKWLDFSTLADRDSFRFSYAKVGFSVGLRVGFSVGLSVGA